MLAKKTKVSKPGVDLTREDQLLGPSSLRKEILSRYKTVEKFYEKWIKEAKEDYEFALGDQWTDEDRQILANEGRPCLQFNRIRPLINIVSGYQRENSSRIKVNPEGGEDKIFSEVMDKAISYIDKLTHLNYTLGYQFDDGLYVGKSFVEAYKTYDKDPIRGELNFQLCTPYQILTDPEFKGYDLNDGCGYAFKLKRLSKYKLIELFPDKKNIINHLKEDVDDISVNIDIDMVEGDKDDYGNNPNKTTTAANKSDEIIEADIDEDTKFTLKEYWRPKRVKRWFVIDADSAEPVKFDTIAEAEAFAAQQGPRIKPVERMVKEMWVADYVAGVILQDVRSPLAPEYDGFTFFRFLADWAPNSEREELRVQGMTRQLKDPQREKNKAKSQGLHILNTQANSGWIADEDALTPADFKKLEKFGSKPGLVVKKKKNSELREIQPKGVANQAYVIREQQADEEFKQIANINPDLLGMQDNSSTSGKAMQTRIKQAIMALARLFSNYRYTKEIIGNFILAMIPSIFDSKKLARLLGSKYMESAGINEGHLKGFLTMIKDRHYDVMVAEADSQMTIRYETFMELVELAKAGTPIPPDLFIEYMDMPNSDEVKNRVMKYAQEQMAAAAAAKGAPAA